MPTVSNLHAKALSASLQSPTFTTLPNKWKGLYLLSYIPGH